MEIGIGLGLTMGGAPPAFNPASLFGASDTGAIYDPFILSSLSQDSLGSTPVTTVGQTVGMGLDTRFGLAVGQELWAGQTPVITEVGSTSTWTPGSRTMATTGGTSGQYPWFSFGLGLVTGKTYQLTLALSGDIAKVNSIVFGNEVLTASASISVKITAAAASLIFKFIGTSGAATVVVDSISVREIHGNHATQATAGARPTYQIDANGRPYLSFDGVDDWLSTAVINWGSDTATIVAAVQKTSDAAQACVVALGLNGGPPGVNSENAMLTAPGSSAATYWFRAGGTTTGSPAIASGFPAPNTAVLAAQADISADLQSLRVNGNSAVLGTGDLGAGNFGTGLVTYIGRRGGATQPFSGRIYGLIIINRILSANEMDQARAWCAARSGVTL